MRREVLTPSRCREDILKLQRFDRRLIVILAISELPLLLMIAFLYVLEYSAYGGMDWTAIVALMAMVVLMFGAILFLFCYEQYRIHQIKNGELMIVEDLLTLSYEDVEKRGGGGGRHAIHVRVFILEFQHMGRFRVPRRPHYEWSKIYSMSDEGVYNTSTLGDRFYVVYLKNARKQEPLMVYNTNLFELCEDGTAPRTGGSWKDSVSLE